jgi:hypothetical protein
MRQPVIEIAAKEDHVVVGCQYDSFSMYRFDEAKVGGHANALPTICSFYVSDRTPRIPHGCVMCDKRFFVGTDVEGNLVGLAYSK